MCLQFHLSSLHAADCNLNFSSNKSSLIPLKKTASPPRSPTQTSSSAPAWRLQTDPTCQGSRALFSFFPKLYDRSRNHPIHLYGYHRRGLQPVRSILIKISLFFKILHEFSLTEWFCIKAVASPMAIRF